MAAKKSKQPVASRTESERKTAGHALGVHRVLDTEPRLPQAAEKLDNGLPLFSNEILIRVEFLNIDAASFVQMEKEFGGDAKKIGECVLGNTRTRGKQHNRVTGSGGMLVGTVQQIGSTYKGPVKLKVGDSIASLISLTLTPLHLEKILSVDLKTHQIGVEGHAILFDSSPLAILPKDLPERVTMAALDVCGAPALVAHWAKAGQTCVILGGGGKAGTLSCVAARKRVGARGKIIAIEPFEKAAVDLEKLGVCDAVLRVNACDPLLVQASVAKATRGKMGDIVVNVASVPDTEVAALLSAKKTAKILYFGMATSFTKVALGAEGIGSTATLIFGNGYFPGHAALALDLLRKNKKLKDLFLQRYQ